MVSWTPEALLWATQGGTGKEIQSGHVRGLCWVSSGACQVTGATCHERALVPAVQVWGCDCRTSGMGTLGTWREEQGRTTLPVVLLMAKTTCRSHKTNSTAAPIINKFFFTS